MPVDVEKRQELQDRLAAKAIKSLLTGQDVTIVAPTGVGKTNVFIDIANKFANGRSETKILIVTDRLNVVAQNKKRAEKLGVSNASLSTDGNLDQKGQFVYGSTKTLSNNADKLGKYDLLVIDECHHAADNGASQHSAIIDALSKKNSNVAILGLSAFIDRADGLTLHNRLRDSEFMRVTYQDALAINAITPCKNFTVDRRLKDGENVNDVIDARLDPDRPDLSMGGIEKALRQSRPDNFFEHAVREWQRANKNSTTPTFVYCTTIKESELAAKAFENADVPVQIVHSRLSEKQIAKAFDEYRSGAAVALVSVDMLTEGVDETKTASVLVLKETTTRAQWIQINGRAARAHSDIDPITNAERHKVSYSVIDMGASSRLHGTMDMYRQVENYLFNESKHPVEWSPWRTVQAADAERGRQPIYALHDGRTTLFAAKLPRSNAYAIFTKNEIRIGSRKHSAVTTVKKLHPKSVSIDELKKIGRDHVADRMGVFVTLDSRPGPSSLTALVKQSFSESQHMIERFMTPSAQQIDPKRLRAGNER